MAYRHAVLPTRPRGPRRRQLPPAPRPRGGRLGFADPHRRRPIRAGDRVEGRHRAGHRVHRGRPDRLGRHRAAVPRLPARGRRALRRDAERPVFDEGSRARGLHPDQQRREHAERDLRDARHHPRRPPGEARHDGRIRHTQHRHRRGLHRDRPQRAQRHAPVPQAARLDVSPVEGARLAQHPLRLPRVGDACHRPEPGRRLRHRDRRDRPGRPAHDALRLRRRVRHGAEPLLPAGRDRTPAHRVRQGRADPRLPQHRRHAAMRRARRS